jgi:cold shock CspA family protein
LKNGCPFKIGSTVYFFEVNYADDKQELKHFFTGSALPPVSNSNGLSDDGEANQTVEKNNGFAFIAPQDNGASKTFVKSQADQIMTLTQINASDRTAFDKERKDYLKKIEEQNKEIVDLNILINTLKAEKTALEIRYEESQRMMQMFNSREPEPVDEEPQGLADKAVATIDTVLGDGASANIIAGLASGAGAAIPKLLDIGIAWATKKGLIPETPTPEPQPMADNYPLYAGELNKSIINN